MKSKPFISFCIPTYNRSYKASELVKNILLYEDDNIEVVVLDNCSTDETKLLFSNIKDSRLRFISNSENIGGILNVLKVVAEAKGEYSILCLDKDYINYKEISSLINHLKDNKDILFGYCSLNLDSSYPNKLFEKGFSSVLNMAYQSKHPSGNFYKTEAYKNSRKLVEMINNNSKFEFNFDLINAEMAFLGKSLIINHPLFFTEKKVESASIPSYTYNRNNLYFEPKRRHNEFGNYMSSVCELDILEKEKINLFKLLYAKGLSATTFMYKVFLSDNLVCLHHGIETRKVGYIELFRIDMSYSLFFLKKHLSISFFRKCVIVINEHFRIFFNMIK